MARPKKKAKAAIRTNLKYELYGIVILTLSIIALSREGPVARALTYLFRFVIGSWDFIFPLIFIYVGLYVMVKRQWPTWKTSRKAGIFLMLLALLMMSHISLFEQLYPKGKFTAGMIMSQSWSSMVDGLKATDKGQAILTNEVGGGMLGASLYAILYSLFANIGAKLIQYTLLVIGFILLTGISIVDLIEKLKGKQSFSDSLLAQYIKRKILERRTKLAAVPNIKKKTMVPYIPDESEFDEETLKPERKIKKDGKKRSLFYDLLQPKQSVDREIEAVKSSDEIEEEVKVPTMAKPPVEEQLVFQREVEPEPLIPVIRDFQEHVQHEVSTTQSKGSDVVKSAPDANAEPSNDDSGAVEDFTINNKPVALPYELPSFDLLSKPNLGKGADSLDYKAVARKLEATLESFGVRAKVLEVVRGPSVTRYEIQPDVGVKVSRIVSLTDDIALALAAKDIRMEAPIPGKSAIGIEVPNLEVSIVTMREVMESGAFQESSSKLSITFGRDISGQPIVGNLARMPHMLVAGATGSGKSVCINGIITSILYKAKPDEVKFLMIDPKMVELNVYNGIPHLLAPVVTDPRRASLALKKVVVEMEKRYELFSKSGTRNIEGYNNMLVETQTGAPLPYIVVIVDELADLMMVAANDVEDAICRLAQMARAAGIHLIIATQRPSVDVITGVIKANIPSRIAFGVSSQVDSRTILDMVGAEKLLGRGDMLYLPMGASKPVRVQGAFLSDNEVETVVNFVRTQGQANYVEDMVPQIEEQPEVQEQVEDELYDQAVQIILEAKQASVSLLQRRMRVGYTRAARLIDSMEAKGIVGPYEGSKPREVLVSLEQYQDRMSS
ncbi:FtsK/SpoIIIE family DNA translocase [Paenibacillus radicis (ex Xue et al. 2023)]|uniref:DNA translocase FtsK n=1 Tax=Paenibacillus radicis (ex Xue et al. 2023) TaxID=2972489 RepID=A0ABT1YFL9_9BACL|nr:DNA translocase FtsK [Paenibacillus radicis (ex Xue et al. 2023)]MCR8630750.1 DNA translocase FtsK [Paenibacillus radicis (ex Xue et al. 2023)]